MANLPNKMLRVILVKNKRPRKLGGGTLPGLSPASPQPPRGQGQVHSDPQRRKKVIPRRACSAPNLGPLRGDGSATEEGASGGKHPMERPVGARTQVPFVKPEQKTGVQGSREHAGHT